MELAKHFSISIQYKYIHSGIFKLSETNLKKNDSYDDIKYIPIYVAGRKYGTTSKQREVNLFLITAFPYHQLIVSKRVFHISVRTYQ